MQHLATTLSPDLQQQISATLQTTLNRLKALDVHQGAALAVDHRNGEILAWVNVSAQGNHRPDTRFIDAVTALRQPGSALKPFIYALALEKGWTAATLIEDTPLTQSVGHGLHPYRNYSRRHYGAVRLRAALGNSLNIPAVRAVQHVGADTLLAKLRSLGFSQLNRHPDFYGDGLALGNGEVSLLELVRAYTCLARGGECITLKWLPDQSGARQGVFSAETATLIADILSDPGARSLEFGAGGLMNFPVQTAIKTGTSSDFRDAWAVGFNHRYTVGVWMGNLDYLPTNGLTGARGPVPALRSIFAELNRGSETQRLKLSTKLVQREICLENGLPARDNCPSQSEWFIPGAAPQDSGKPANATKSRSSVHAESSPIRLRQPTQGLQLALDPRIPEDAQAFRLEIESRQPVSKVEWWMDSALFSTTQARATTWPVSQGEHHLLAKVWLDEPVPEVYATEARFVVK